MIIQSLLDTDLYKFTMMQVVLHHFPGAHVEYRFNCRTRGVDLAPYVDEIREEIAYLCLLRFRESELEYLRGMRFIKSDFVDFLGLFQLHMKSIRVERSADASGGISIVDQGPVAAHDPVRDPRAGHRQRGVLPQHAAQGGLRRGSAPPAGQGRAGARQPGARRLPHRRLRHAPALLAPVARRSADDAEEGAGREPRRHQQRHVCRQARPDAAGDDGARVPAGLPGAGAAPA